MTMRPSLREVTDAFIRLIACGSDSSFSMRGFHFPDGPYVEYVLNDESRKVDLKKAAEKDRAVLSLYVRDVLESESAQARTARS